MPAVAEFSRTDARRHEPRADFPDAPATAEKQREVSIDGTRSSGPVRRADVPESSDSAVDQVPDRWPGNFAHAWPRRRSGRQFPRDRQTPSSSLTEKHSAGERCSLHCQTERTDTCRPSRHDECSCRNRAWVTLQMPRDPARSERRSSRSYRCWSGHVHGHNTHVDIH